MTEVSGPLPALPTIEPMEAARPLRVHALIASLTWGGAEMLLSEFAAGAPAAGIELSVGYLEDRDGSPAAARLRNRGVDPVLAAIHGPRPLINRTDHRTVREHLEQVRPDVLHTHLGYADMLGGMAARSLGIPSVSTLHVMEWYRSVRQPSLYAKERLMALVRRRTAARVIAVSEAARRAFLDTGWDSPERVVTVHNGIVAEPTRGAGRDVRERLGLGPTDVVATMLTVLRRGKGHDVAAAAVAALRERFPQLRLVIAGDGPDRAEIERAAAPLGDGAVMTGHVDDVMPLLDATDVLLHPTLVDAFPTALLEAMAAAVPIVASAVGGIPEIVDDGHTGTLVPAPPDSERVAAALSPLIEDAALRRRLGEAGRERFRRDFTVEAWGMRMRPVYEAALRAGSGDG
jgi:glycosyltransferase involved in cell wall biosynthesis